MVKRGLGRFEKLAETDEGQLHEELLVGGRAIVEVAVVEELHCRVIPLQREGRGLLGEAAADVVGSLEQRQRPPVGGHHEVAHMLRQRIDEEEGVKAAVAHLFVEEQGLRHVPFAESVDELEEVIVVEHVEVLHHRLVGDVSPAGGAHLVEDRKGVAHSSVGLAGDHPEGAAVGRDPLLRGDVGEMVGDVVDRDALEVIDLATRQDGRDHLVFLGGGQDENGVGRGLLEGFQEGVERRLGEHVDLVDDEDAVVAHLRGDVHLLGDRADVVDAVVGGGVEFDEVVGDAAVDRLARLAFAASLPFGSAVEAVEGLGEDAGAGGLAHASRTAEKICVRKPVAVDGALQCRRQIGLTHNAMERRRTIFACAYYIVVAHVGSVVAGEDSPSRSKFS